MGALTWVRFFCLLLSDRLEVAEEVSAERQDAPSDLEVNSGLDFRVCLLSPPSSGWQHGGGGWSSLMTCQLLCCPRGRGRWGMEGREMCWLVALCSWDLGVFNAHLYSSFLETFMGFEGDSSLWCPLFCSSHDINKSLSWLLEAVLF